MSKTTYWTTSDLAESRVLSTHALLTKYVASKKLEDLNSLVSELVNLSEFALEKERHCIGISETCKALNIKCANLEVELSNMRDELEHFKKEEPAKADEDVSF